MPVLYDEPKRLVALGLASATAEQIGQRTRIRYAITPRGHTVLAAWLASPPHDPRLEMEPMLRLLFADQGTKAEGLRAVRSLGEWADRKYAEGRQQVAGYLSDGGPFPERLHLSALFAALYAQLFEVIGRWAAFADMQIDSWPGTAGLGMTMETRQLFESLLARDGLSRPG